MGSYAVDEESELAMRTYGSAIRRSVSLMIRFGNAMLAERGRRRAREEWRRTRRESVYAPTGNQRG